MTGLLADNNATGHVEALVRRMRADPWGEFWTALGLVYHTFGDVNLTATSTDLEIWRTCQAEGLILITDNRNHDGPDSLEAVIRDHNTPASLPVVTIADLDRFRTSREYVERVVASLYDHLLRLDEVRGAGRLYVP